MVEVKGDKWEQFDYVIDIRETQRFLRSTTDLGIIASGATSRVNLEALKQEFGNNFNTIIITNNSTEEISYTLNGQKRGFVNGNSSSLSLDWRDGIIFDDLAITNEDGANATSANEIRITVGRTGDKGA
jgi:hypothetical protein